MQKLWIVISIIFFTLNTQAQHIAEVLTYQPAPGQLINEAPWGVGAAAQSIVGTTTGTMTLGAWGGYVVFRFDTPVENNPEHPFGVDFTIFGNPMPDWSEPGIVWVMQDANNNGEPDDTWYELAGSDYYFSSTIKSYEVTYTNPQQNQAADVPWIDNMGQNGLIIANSTHTQPYYPLNADFQQIPTDSYTLTGTRIQPEVDSTTFMTKVRKRGFGYVDNQLRGSEPWTTPDNPYTNEKENAGGDAFDISWAVDDNGNYVDLNQIDFVKVQNGMLAHGGWLGEISTEITGAAKVLPNAALTGVEQMIVLRDLPPVISTTELQLEALVFDQGRPIETETIVWTCSEGASIDENQWLHVTQSGSITITATLQSNEAITTSATAVVDLGNAIQNVIYKTLDVCPNPAIDFIHVQQQGELFIYNAHGQLVDNEILQNKPVNVSHLPEGLYILKCFNNKIISTTKLLKK